MFRKKLSAIVVAALFAAPCVSISEEEVLDGVAAVVNGDVITFSQVRELVGARERSLREMYKGQELIEKIKETRLSAIKDLIDRQLVLQEFTKNKFSIPDHIVDDHIQVIIREEFGGDRAAFIRTLQAQGYTMERFRNSERDKIIVQAMRQKSVSTNLMISPQKVDEYYATHREEFSDKDLVKLRMIVLKEGASSESLKKLAEEIRGKIEAGGDFAKLAQMYSQDSTQESGGDWGWVDRSTLNPELTKVAFSMKPGTVSKVFDVGGNFYLLYVEARKNSTAKPLAEVRDEIEKKLLQAEQQRLQEKWIDGLRQKAYVKTF
jgi:parvulin-like peptidyl-prolyl isomerase